MGSFFFVKKTGGCRQPGKIDSPLNEKLNSVKWGEFRLGDLFEIEGTKSLDSNAIDFVETGINFIGRTFENNGIQGKILKRNFEPNEPFTITATVIGNYKYVKYQKEPYYCSQNINKLTPKKIICKWTEKIAYFSIGIINGISIVASPFVKFLTFSTNVISRLFGVSENDEETVTEEEIRMMVDVGQESGTIEDEEKEMINNIFEFNDKTVSDIMCHRMDIFAYNHQLHFSELVQL